MRDSHPDTWFPATSRTAHGHPVALRERSSYDAASSARSTGSTQGHREGWRAQRQDVVRLAREEVVRGPRQGTLIRHNGHFSIERCIQIDLVFYCAIYFVSSYAVIEFLHLQQQISHRHSSGLPY